MAEGFTMTRVFDAPRELVWREWTEPERFADWYGGSAADIPLDTVEMDVREGGQWRATMFYGPDRREIRWHGEYHEVVPLERLVFAVSDQPGEDAYELCTVTLVDIGGGGTEMRLEQRGGQTPQGYEAAKKGWGVFLDRMAERLGAGG
jgi:uncharacterized protein YndB with AHSA1/START domain